MAYNYTDNKRMEEAEERCFQSTKRIFEKYFGNSLIKIEKMPNGCHIDARVSAATNNGDVICYAIETKTNNKFIDGFTKDIPLHVRKYLYMKDEQRPNERLIYIHFINNHSQFLVFDLSDLNEWDVKDLHLRNWRVQKENYTTRERAIYEDIPTMFFSLDKVTFSGSTN